uniref:Uncharacterized protein n=1 Tax=Asterionellopsis glacialis TaxID=33640 RepID=A0A7S0PSV7_9STRA|mmetsp:Transcript_1248/g.1732  ORF Transcript_1248/g.1732 Transcript_1248/m.1732 type:complete len:143 (+) Transcript_1248:105-533(+)
MSLARNSSLLRNDSTPGFCFVLPTGQVDGSFTFLSSPWHGKFPGLFFTKARLPIRQRDGLCNQRCVSPTAHQGCLEHKRNALCRRSPLQKVMFRVHKISSKERKEQLFHLGETFFGPAQECSTLSKFEVLFEEVASRCCHAA